MKNMSFRIQNRINWIAIGVLWIFTAALTFRLNPFRDNLTGLGWVKGQTFLMSVYACYACGLNAWLSWSVFSGSDHPKIVRYVWISWIIALIGCLIPFDESGSHLFSSDLHLLISTAGAGVYLVMMAMILTSPLSNSEQRKSAKAVWLAFAPSLLFFGFSQSISWLSEVCFICLNATILAWIQSHSENNQ